MALSCSSAPRPLPPPPRGFLEAQSLIQLTPERHLHPGKGLSCPPAARGPVQDRHRRGQMRWGLCGLGGPGACTGAGRGRDLAGRVSAEGRAGEAKAQGWGPLKVAGVPRSMVTPTFASCVPASWLRLQNISWKFLQAKLIPTLTSFLLLFSRAVFSVRAGLRVS